MARTAIGTTRSTSGTRTAVDKGAQYSLSLNGTTSYIINFETPTLVSTLNKVFTIEFWVKGATGQNSKGIFQWNRSSGTGLYQIQTNTSGKLVVFIRNDGNSILLNSVNSTTTVFDGNWHHVAYADNAGTVSLYIDGVLDGTNFNYTASGTFLTTNRTVIGAAYTSSASSFFAGSIRRFRLYNVALDQTQVTAAYQNTSTLRSNIIHELVFDAGTGNNIANSGNSGASWGGVAVAYTTDVPTNSNSKFTRSIA